MAVSRDDVLRIAGLANLHLDEEELETFTGQFQRILDYVEKLREVDVSGVPATSHVSRTDFGERVMREDGVRSSLSPEESLANAPDASRGHFRVPKVI